MERKSLEYQKKQHTLKLPVITHRKGESSRILSSTMPENSRVRPSSLQKVDNLEKKLFEKLDSYENIVKKASKRASKKKISVENVSQKPSQGYERMQKLMPNLYTKLVEAKKGVISDTVIPIDNQNTPQQKINKIAIVSEEQKFCQPLSNKKPSFQEEQIADMTEQQFEAVYRQYSRKQQLRPQTTDRELKAMNQNLQICEKQIAELTHSMESLISEIGKEYLVELQQQ